VFSHVSAGHYHWEFHKSALARIFYLIAKERVEASRLETGDSAA
jgi:hypothetical protein